MAPRLTTFFFALLLLEFLCCWGNNVSGDDDHPQGTAVAKAGSFRHKDVCSGSKDVPSGNLLRLVRRYGPCSPLGDAVPNHHQILLQDLKRVAYLQNRVKLASARGNMSMDALHASLEVTLGVHDGEVINSDNFVVTVGLGTPTRMQTVTIDTGSNVCWVQCMPCQTCYTQQQMIFNPRTSRSYRNVKCDDPACTHLPESTRGCVDNNCVYRIRYIDNSSSAGFLATEKLTLKATTVFEHFVFGCGRINKGHFSGVAGLLGLGRAFHSVMTQTSNRLGRVFSYCLPAYPHSVGHLAFGRRTTPSPVYTPMLLGPRDYDGLYFIHLSGISVGEHRLPVSPPALGSSNTIIDSATVITRLPAIAYTELRTAFRHHMEQHKLAEAQGILDTCYDIGSQDQFDYPQITFHFNGTDLVLKIGQVFFHPDNTTYCLAFAAAEDDGLTIIGNTQQLGMEVIYDIANSRIGFSKEVQC